MKRFISIVLIVCFAMTLVIAPQPVRAEGGVILPTPGTMVNLSPAYEPALIKGLTIHKDNPFLFDFIVDTGNDKKPGTSLGFKQDADRLIKYFFACLTIPEKDLWVNLSPYEKDRMVPDALGKTALGRDLLAQDYILKQLTASLIYPEKALGQDFWNRVYTKAQQMYGTSEIPVNTFNKVWILADKATVYEHNQTAFVVDGHLKVMLEEDYLALDKNKATVIASEAKQSHTISSQIIKEIILPELEKEVNTAKNFATLRQIFNSQILATWYKKNLKEALLNQVYGDKSTVKGIDNNNPKTNQDIYDQYIQAYKKGVFNYIKEEPSFPPTGGEGQGGGTTTPRKYFSGGYGSDLAMTVVKNDMAMARKASDSVGSQAFDVTATVGFNNAPVQTKDDSKAMTAGKVMKVFMPSLIALSLSGTQASASSMLPENYSVMSHPTISLLAIGVVGLAVAGIAKIKNLKKDQTVEEIHDAVMDGYYPDFISKSTSSAFMAFMVTVGIGSVSLLAYDGIWGAAKDTKYINNKVTAEQTLSEDDFTIIIKRQLTQYYHRLNFNLRPSHVQALLNQVEELHPTLSQEALDVLERNKIGVNPAYRKLLVGLQNKDWKSLLGLDFVKADEVLYRHLSGKSGDTQDSSDVLKMLHSIRSSDPLYNRALLLSKYVWKDVLDNLNENKRLLLMGELFRQWGMSRRDVEALVSVRGAMEQRLNLYVAKIALGRDSRELDYADNADLETQIEGFNEVVLNDSLAILRSDKSVEVRRKALNDLLWYMSEDTVRDMLKDPEDVQLFNQHLVELKSGSDLTSQAMTVEAIANATAKNGIFWGGALEARLKKITGDWSISEVDHASHPKDVVKEALLNPSASFYRVIRGQSTAERITTVDEMKRALGQTESFSLYKLIGDKSIFYILATDAAMIVAQKTIEYADKIDVKEGLEEILRDLTQHLNGSYGWQTRLKGGAIELEHNRTDRWRGGSYRDHYLLTLVKDQVKIDINGRVNAYSMLPAYLVPAQHVARGVEHISTPVDSRGNGMEVKGHGDMPPGTERMYGSLDDLVVRGGGETKGNVTSSAAILKIEIWTDNLDRTGVTIVMPPEALEGIRKTININDQGYVIGADLVRFQSSQAMMAAEDAYGKVLQEYATGTEETKRRLSDILHGERVVFISELFKSDLTRDAALNKFKSVIEKAIAEHASFERRLEFEVYEFDLYWTGLDKTRISNILLKIFHHGAEKEKSALNKLKRVAKGEKKRFLPEEISILMPEGLVDKQGEMSDVVREVASGFQEPVKQEERKVYGIYNRSTKKFTRIFPKESFRKHGRPDSAMPPGGIDLNAANMGLVVEKDVQGGVKVTFDPAMIERIRRDGVQSVVPVIINITPIADIRPLLGLAPRREEEERQLARS